MLLRRRRWHIDDFFVDIVVVVVVVFFFIYSERHTFKRLWLYWLYFETVLFRARDKYFK